MAHFNVASTLRNERTHMRIQIHDRGPVIVLDLHGKLVVGESSDRVCETVDSLVARGRNHILLNLAAVSHVDTTGLGTLSAAFVHVSRSGGQIKLAGVSKRVRELPMVARSLTVFETFSSETEALG